MSLLRAFRSKLRGKHLHFVYFSSYTLFALVTVLHLFFPHLISSTLHGLNSGMTRSALFIIVYLERTCFIRQAVLPSTIDCKASVDWIVERGDGKRRESVGEPALKWEKPFSTSSSSMKCIKLMCLTCCIDMKNIDFRQNETPRQFLGNYPQPWHVMERWHQMVTALKMAENL